MLSMKYQQHSKCMLTSRNIVDFLANMMRYKEYHQLLAPSDRDHWAILFLHQVLAVLAFHHIANI